MFEGPLCPNLSQKVQKEVSQMANHNLSRMILLGGLSVNLNHLKIGCSYLPCCNSGSITRSWGGKNNFQR